MFKKSFVLFATGEKLLRCAYVTEIRKRLNTSAKREFTSRLALAVRLQRAASNLPSCRKTMVFRQADAAAV